MNGVMDGYGKLRLPNADEYAGQFRAGKANGTGRHVDVTGESFEGPFVNGLRDGRGTTRLPDGTSYRSSWVAGEETEGSRAVRVSQAGPPRAPGGSDDVQVAVELPQPADVLRRLQRRAGAFHRAGRNDGQDVESRRRHFVGRGEHADIRARPDRTAVEGWYPEPLDAGPPSRGHLLRRTVERDGFAACHTGEGRPPE